MTTMVRLLAAIVALGAVVGSNVVAAQPLPDERNTGYQPVVVVLDVSDSMNEGSGAKTKIAAARAAVLDLVDQSAAQTPFALIAYPGNNAKSVNGCAIGREEVALGPLDHSAAAAAVRRLTPAGNTPTGPALTHAADLMKRHGYSRGTIVLVSDGESNCGGNPCDVAKKLAAQGVAITVNAVSLQISSKGADELACIAAATSGRYAAAGDADALRLTLRDVSGPRLELTANVPRELPAVSGTGASGSTVAVTVANPGRSSAQDVRVSLDFQDGSGTPSAILVPHPVRFLGNIEAGKSVTVPVVVRPDASRLGTYTWLAAATARNANPPPPARGETRVVEPFGKLTGLLGGVERATIVGDSYSSGEGAGTYVAGSADRAGGTMCHRSTTSYGHRLFADKATVIACSGAVTGDFRGPQASGRGVLPQLHALRDNAIGPDSPGAVLLTLGGNDIGFAELVTGCFWSDNCRIDINTREFDRRFAALLNDLRAVYLDIDRAVNDPVARGRRNGTTAPIVVLPYPRIAPFRERGTGECFAGISAAEVTFMNEVIDRLNLHIFVAVRSLPADVPVYYADDVVAAFQPNHTICDGSESYAVTLTMLGGDPDNDRSMFDVVVDEHRKNELAHPNEYGHAAMARALIAWSAHQVPKPDTGRPQWQGVAVKDRDLLGRLSAAQWLAALRAYEAGGNVRVRADGYRPGSTVAIRVESTPRVLSGSTVGPDGRVDATAWLPEDVPPGSHTVYVAGFDSAGQPREVAIPIRVLAPRAKVALVLLALGVIATSVGVSGFVVGRRDRARQRDTATSAEPGAAGG